jgi:hypothetical protein
MSRAVRKPAHAGQFEIDAAEWPEAGTNSLIEVREWRLVRFPQRVLKGPTDFGFHRVPMRGASASVL